MHSVNVCLYPAGGRPVNDLARLVTRFRVAFADQPDLAGYTDAALRVLATAAALFYQRGAVATSVRDVTGACGLTPGAMYNHFPSKDDLLDAIVTHGHESMRRRLDAALADCPDVPADQLAAFVRAYVIGHLVQPELAQVVRREYLHLSRERYEKVVAVRRGVRRRLSAILQAGAADGRFDIVGGRDAVTAQAVMLLDMCSRTSEWFDRGGKLGIDTLAERYVVVARRIVGVP